MKVALIGGGEVGRCYASALHKAGHDVYVVIDSYPSQVLQDLCIELGANIEHTPSATLQEADLIISAVFGSVALEVAEKAASFIKPHAMYADFTTGKPDDILAASVLVSRYNVDFVDVAIASTVNLFKEKTPLLLAGSTAEKLLPIIQQLGAKATIVGTEPGAAVSLKLLRSVFTKGCEALAVECFMAAQEKGLLSAFYDVISDIDERPISEFLASCVNSHVVHAGRRLVEVQEAIEQLQSVGVEPLASQGVEGVFKRSAAALKAEPYQAGTLEQNIAWLKKTQQFNSK